MTNDGRKRTNETRPENRPNQPQLATHSTWSITPATSAQLAYIIHLQSLHTGALGFVPKSAIVDHIKRDSYHILELDGQAAGYIMHNGGHRRPYRIIQVALDEELWRLGFGSHLIHVALTRAQTRPNRATSVTVADGLAMCDVATATGATRTKTYDPKNTRHRRLHEYLWIPRTELTQFVGQPTERTKCVDQEDDRTHEVRRPRG